MEQLHGILLLNKPAGLSSAQAVSRIKRLGQKKIGHGGTLDPMATGLLIVLLGSATKLSNYLLEGGEKTYQGVLELGKVSDTWDKEGAILAKNPVQTSPEEVRHAIADWINITSQPVPPYSAAKHKGQPLYKLARAGKEVPAKEKFLKISHAEVLQILWEDYQVRFRVTCSSGSYIRSLAHSLGIRLGCGAVLTELTREYSHPFALQDAHTLDSLLAQPETLPEKVLPIAAALPAWPVLTLHSPQEEDSVKNGRTLPSTCPAGTRALLMSRAGLPLALVEARPHPSGQAQWTILRGL